MTKYRRAAVCCSRVTTCKDKNLTKNVNYVSENKKVAIKIQKLTPETQSLILEEYHILRDFTGHPNLPDFYGIYRRRSAKKSEYDEIWFVMEVNLR